MNSEKVEEIKKALQDHSIEKLKYQDGIKIKELDFIDILTLINELESENENLKINLHETENLSFQINQMNGNLILVNQRLHTELKKYKKALELIGKQYMSDMGMGKSIEDDTEYYEINLRNIIQTAIKQAGQEEQEWNSMRDWLKETNMAMPI